MNLSKLQISPGPWNTESRSHDSMRPIGVEAWHRDCDGAKFNVALVCTPYGSATAAANGEAIASVPEMLAALANAHAMLTKLREQADNVKIYAKSAEGSRIVASTVRELCRDGLGPINAVAAKLGL